MLLHFAALHSLAWLPHQNEKKSLDFVAKQLNWRRMVSKRLCGSLTFTKILTLNQGLFLGHHILILRLTDK